MTCLLQAVDTIHTADSVEWCPVEGFERILACGTYQLMENGIRQGSITLFRWSQHQHVICKAFTGEFLDGILDSKWAPINGELLLGLASSCGDIVLLKLEASLEDELVTRKVERIPLHPNGTQTTLCLSLDWSKDSSQPLSVVGSDSNGYLHLVDSATCTVTHSWKAHDFEAWIGAFDRDCSVVFSGGDDCKLHVWDTRCLSRPAATSMRHEMGVCSIQVHPTVENVLASGSYDETLRLWDRRRISQPIKELKLGGGVWRVKWHRSHPDWVATACMHNGFAIVDCHLKASDPVEVVCSYKGHSSLAYGVDWCQLEHETWRSGGRYTALLATCSFYDHSMHLWTTHLPT